VNARQSPGVIAGGGGNAPYNYAPTVMVDGNRYRMWWCSQLNSAYPPGDDILLAESASLDGGFGGPDGRPGTPVLSGSQTGFDAVHVCDPSVLKVGGTYYLYYTGSAGDRVHANTIGMATSPDGVHWTRGGQPILVPAHNVFNDNVYGAGQPSAVFVDGWYYLMFTDTTGRGVGSNGAGQFILRSTNPAFVDRVEALTPGGFQAATDTSARFRPVEDAFSADLMWVDTLNAFALAHETAGGTTITFWDKDFRTNPAPEVLIPGPWREGPGLVRRTDGHAVQPAGNQCDGVAIDLVRATREGPNGPTDLRHYGVDLVDLGGCATRERALVTLNGYAMPSPERTIDLIIAGQLVLIDRRSMAETMAVRILDGPVPALATMAPVARITPGLPAVRAPGRGVGLVIDGKLWQLASTVPAERNSSPVVDISPAAWDVYPKGPDLIAPPR
jgi:hypothetical protein